MKPYNIRKPKKSNPNCLTVRLATKRINRVYTKAINNKLITKPSEEANFINRDPKTDKKRKNSDLFEFRRVCQ